MSAANPNLPGINESKRGGDSTVNDGQSLRGRGDDDDGDDDESFDDDGGHDDRHGDGDDDESYSERAARI